MRISDWSSDVCSSDLAVALGEVVMPVDWTPLVALALSSQVVGQGLLIWALPRFSPLVIGLTLLVQPAIAALPGWLMFGERLGALDLAGGLMGGAALVLLRLPRRRQRDRKRGVWGKSVSVMVEIGGGR